VCCGTFISPPNTTAKRTVESTYCAGGESNPDLNLKYSSVLCLCSSKDLVSPVNVRSSLIFILIFSLIFSLILSLLFFLHCLPGLPCGFGGLRWKACVCDRGQGGSHTSQFSNFNPVHGPTKEEGEVCLGDVEYFPYSLRFSRGCDGFIIWPAYVILRGIYT
jgi:hypothetical protein